MINRSEGKIIKILSIFDGWNLRKLKGLFYSLIKMGSLKSSALIGNG